MENLPNEINTYIVRNLPFDSIMDFAHSSHTAYNIVKSLFEVSLGGHKRLMEGILKEIRSIKYNMVTPNKSVLTRQQHTAIYRNCLLDVASEDFNICYPWDTHFFIAETQDDIQVRGYKYINESFNNDMLDLKIYSNHKYPVDVRGHRISVVIVPNGLNEISICTERPYIYYER